MLLLDAGSQIMDRKSTTLAAVAAVGLGSIAFLLYQVLWVHTNALLAHHKPQVRQLRAARDKAERERQHERAGRCRLEKEFRTRIADEQLSAGGLVFQPIGHVKSCFPEARGMQSLISPSFNDI